MLLLFVHPIVQFLAVILACYVLYLGYRRFLSFYLKQTVPFLWKRHVTLGLVALATLFVGMAGGMAMVYIFWRSYFITGLHAKVALVLVVLILFGILSGLYMHLKKRKRKWLPLLHLANNVILLLLCVVQIITGWNILTKYVLGL